MSKWIFGQFVVGALLVLIDYVFPGQGFNYMAAFFFLVLGILMTYLFLAFGEFIFNNADVIATKKKRSEIGVQKSPKRIVMCARQPR